MNLIEMTIDHYNGVLALLQATSGVCVRTSDSLENTERYLNRNPGLSFVAICDGDVVGCAMAGHDGRRGYLQHVVVKETLRGKGIGNSLVLACLEALRANGIFKTHIDVLTTNDVANSYWSQRGWIKREDINKYSMNLSGDENV